MIATPVELTVDELAAKFAGKTETYAGGDPYPHIVVDDFLPQPLFEALVAAFPGPEAEFWDRYDYNYQTKLACNRVHALPPVLRDTLFLLNSGGFLEVLKTLTGERGLVSDPYFVGGGIHQIQRGGKLAVHADFTQPPHLKLYRRLNLLIYLNPAWDESYGGHFELWDAERKACRKRVAPIGNRCVVFTTTATSFHGHPHPLTCPADTTRKSLAIYYYLLDEPQGHAGVLTRWHRKETAANPVAKTRNALSRLLWWLSYKMAGAAGRVDSESGKNTQG